MTIRIRLNIFLTVAAVAMATVMFTSPASATQMINGWTVIDNSYASDADGDFAAVGSWGAATDGFGNNTTYAIGGGGSNTATWTFKNLADGFYEVANHWAPHSNRATDAPFSINSGTPIDINQEPAPVGFSLYDGAQNRPFQILGTYEAVGGEITVQLNDNANQYVMADATAIKDVTSGTVTLQNATADYSQSGFTIDKTLDGDTGSGGWAFSNQFSTDHTAVWETYEDLDQSELTFTLPQNLGSNHTLRKLRFSVTQDDRSTFADGLQTGGDVTANWTELTPLTAMQLGGSPTINGDNTISFPFTTSTETYTVTANTPFGGITGIRLEVLGDGVNSFVGHAGNGNAVLTEFQVEAAAFQVEGPMVPEPHSIAIWSILGICLAGYGYRRRRRNS